MKNIFEKPFKNRRSIIINIHGDTELYQLIVKFANALHWRLATFQPDNLPN